MVYQAGTGHRSSGYIEAKTSSRSKITRNNYTNRKHKTTRRTELVCNQNKHDSPSHLAQQQISANSTMTHATSIPKVALDSINTMYVNSIWMQQTNKGTKEIVVVPGGNTTAIESRHPKHMPHNAKQHSNGVHSIPCNSNSLHQAWEPQVPSNS